MAIFKIFDKDSKEKRILEILRSKEALTYGEVLAEYCGSDPYFASLTTNVYYSKPDVSKLNLFFDSDLESAEKVYSCYASILPCIMGLEKNRLIQHEGIANEKRYETHTNFISDSEEKVMKRFERELERKRSINPTLISVVEDVVKTFSNMYQGPHSAVFSGSGCMKNGRPFIYYGDSNEIKSVSDLDIEIFSLEPISLRGMMPQFNEISRKKKVVLNPVVRVFRNSKEDRDIMKSGVPIIV